MSALTLERERVAQVLADVEELRRVSADLPVEKREAIGQVTEHLIGRIGPIRIRVAGELLNLTDRTVRAWMEEGVLTAAGTDKVERLDAHRLVEVYSLVSRLREVGKTRGLLDEVYRRLSDAALLDRADLQENLEQMRRGEGRVVIQGDGRAV